LSSYDLDNKDWEVVKAQMLKSCDKQKSTPAACKGISNLYQSSKSVLLIKLNILDTTYCLKTINLGFKNNIQCQMHTHPQWKLKSKTSWKWASFIQVLQDTMYQKW
jgi:hypothetical protein